RPFSAATRQRGARRPFSLTFRSHVRYEAPALVRAFALAGQLRVGFEPADPVLPVDGLWGGAVRLWSGGVTREGGKTPRARGSRGVPRRVRHAMLKHAPQAGPLTPSATDSLEECNHHRSLEADQVWLLRRNELGSHGIEFERRVRREASEPL